MSPFPIPTHLSTTIALLPLSTYSKTVILVTYPLRPHRPHSSIYYAHVFHNHPDSQDPTDLAPRACYARRRSGLKLADLSQEATVLSPSPEILEHSIPLPDACRETVRQSSAFTLRPYTKLQPPLEFHTLCPRYQPSRSERSSTTILHPTRTHILLIHLSPSNFMRLLQADTIPYSTTPQTSSIDAPMPAKSQVITTIIK